MENARYLNQSILRSLEIVEAFASERAALSIPDISRKVGLHRSTVHRLVVTLESAGWLRKIPGTEKFVLGIKVATLGRIAGEELTSCEIVRPFLEELAKRTGETAILSMADGAAAICVDKIESQQVLKISSEIGQSFPLYAGATGFSVLIGMPEETARGILFSEPLEPFTSRTETDPSVVFEKYLAAKEAGYVVTSGTVDTGVSAVAAPLFFASENAYGSIGVVMPENRATEETIAWMIEVVCEAAAAISRKIGYIKQ